MKVGDIVRPIVSTAGLDSKQQYRVEHVENAPLGVTLAFLVDAQGANMRAVENAHLVLEVVTVISRRPVAALRN